MKILFFNEFTSISGGTDAVFNMELNYLIELGADIRYCSFNNKELLKSSIARQIKIYNSSCYGKSLIVKLQNEIDNYQPDIIHFHNIYQIFRSPVWLKINPGRSKIILHLHNFYPLCLNSLMYRNEFCSQCFDKNSWLPGIRYRCYDNSLLRSFFVSTNRLRPKQWIHSVDKISRIFVVSRYLFNKLLEFGVPYRVMEILPNPVNVHNININGDYVLYLGNISYEKGIDTFCEVAKRLPKLKFIAAGDGKALQYVQKKYSGFPNLSFTGYVDGQRKEELLSQCRFLYFPTRCFETFGMVIIEAFSYGKPVLTTGSGASRRISKERGDRYNQ